MSYLNWLVEIDEEEVITGLRPVHTCAVPPEPNELEAVAARIAALLEREENGSGAPEATQNR